MYRYMYPYFQLKSESQKGNESLFRLFEGIISKNSSYTLLYAFLNQFNRLQSILMID
jgi:hypothetical protein